MRDPQEAIVTKTSDNPKEFTRITFVPDLKRFQMDKFDDDLVALFKRRAYDVAVSTGCKVTLNGKRIAVSDPHPHIIGVNEPSSSHRLGQKSEGLHDDVHRCYGERCCLQESERPLGSRCGQE